VLLTRESIYCRIETYPTQPWEQGFHPCMGCAVRRRMRNFGTVVKVPADSELVVFDAKPGGPPVVSSTEKGFVEQAAGS
jgi:hypothetical protein